MADDKQIQPEVDSTPVKKISAMQRHLGTRIPTADDLKKAGLDVTKAPPIGEWEEQLALLQQTDPQRLDAVRVQIAVQRVLVIVVSQILDVNPDVSSSEVRRKATVMIPTITTRLVGS